MRVLELGAGTGGTTRWVLTALQGQRTTYSFTDVSPAFLEAAQVRFKDAPFLKTALLDLERDPTEQGFAPGSFDIVVASNVLHATTDLARSLARARNLLAEGGVLLLIEGVAPGRWVDLTFGMTKGWWHFTDTSVRPNYPLVSRDRWQALLVEAGFEAIVMTPDQGSRACGQQALIVARRATADRQVTIVASEDEPAASLARVLERRGIGARIVRELPASGVAGDMVHMGAMRLASIPFDAGAAEDATKSACVGPLKDLVAFTRHPQAGRVWLITRGAQPAGGPMAPGARWQAPVWGLGRVFGLEHPDHWGGVVDLPTTDEAADCAEHLFRTLHSADTEDQIAFRNGRRLVGRLAQATATEAAPIALRADGTYVVTGGFGGLGSAIARWLAERGAGRIILTGRNLRPLAADSLRRSMPLAPKSSPFGSMWRARRPLANSFATSRSRSYRAWHCPCSGRPERRADDRAYAGCGCINAPAETDGYRHPGTADAILREGLCRAVLELDVTAWRCRTCALRRRQRISGRHCICSARRLRQDPGGQLGHLECDAYDNPGDQAILRGERPPAVVGG